MPYIQSIHRSMLKSTTNAITLNSPITVGDLNYLVTHLCNTYIDKQLIKNYQTYNDVIGALECCKLEMYRRAVVPYEDEKIKENGDVYKKQVD
jgi:hypothetical protein